MPKVPHGHEDEVSPIDAQTLISYAAVAYLHQELQKVDSITVTQGAFDALERAVDGNTVAALGINFRMGEDGAIVLTEVKRRDDA